MRINKYFLPCFLLVIPVLFFGLLAPASADFKKVNECELARTNASLTGQLAMTRCSPIPAGEGPDCKATGASERCTLILAEGAPDTDVDRLSSVHDDYGYDWLQNRNAVGDVYYYPASPLFSPLRVESGRDGDVSWVKIFLGSQDLGLDSWDIDAVLGSGDATWCGSQNVLCSIHLDGLSVKTNGTSYAKMYRSDKRLGIGVELDATIDRISLATLSLGDCDGFAGYSEAGYWGLKNTNISYVTASGALSIDVARDDIGVKSVHIGIDQINVGMSSLDTTIMLGDKKDFSGTKHVLGSLYMKDLKMNASGHLDIYNPVDNHLATTLGFGLKVPSLTLDTLSWGNTLPLDTLFWGNADVYASASSAGYFGLRNLSINNLAIDGGITLAKETVQDGATDIFPIGTVFVRLVFNKLNVSMASLSTDVALGNRKDNLNQVLGSLYLSDMSMDLNGSVKISAH